MSLLISVLGILKQGGQFIKGLKISEIGLIAAGVVIVFLLLQRSCGKADPKIRGVTCDSIKIELQDFRDMVSVEYIRIDEAPQGEVIRDVDTFWRKHTSFVKTWKDLQKQRGINKKLSRELSEAIANNESITQDQFDDGPVSMFDIDPRDLLPIVETTKKDSTTEYKLTILTEGYGSLIRLEHRIEVTPRTIEVTKTQTKYLDKKSFIAFNFGALYLNDAEQLNYLTSFQYGHNWWNIEAGPVWSKDFKFNGAQLKAGFVIKMKK